eukprot:1289828-Rhodomonas_salina.2
MQKATMDVVEDEEAGPTEVNTTKASHLVKVHKDKLTVTYNGKANHTQDVGVSYRALLLVFWGWAGFTADVVRLLAGGAIKPSFFEQSTHRLLRNDGG